MQIENKLQTDIQLKQLQLNSLLQITEAVNQNFTKNQLFKIFEYVLRSQLKISRLVLYYNTGSNWQTELSYGLNDEFDHSPIINTIATQSADNIRNLDLGFNHSIPVFHKNKPLAYIFIDEPQDQFGSDMISFIKTIANLVIVALENKKMAKDLIKQAGIRKELALAAQMQALLFPARLPKLENLDMAALYLPHQEVGGDYYDFIQLNEKEFIICMADVSGKGMAAALLMSNFQATIHALAKTTTTLTQLVEELNDSVIRIAKGDKFVTLFICKFDIESKEFRYINAGHNPAMLLAPKQTMMLHEGTIGLGMFDKLPNIAEGVLHAESGTEYVLLCYTDGVVELENEAGEHFDYDRLEAFLKTESNDLSMHDMQNKLVKTLYEFKESKPFTDDIALLSCKCTF